MTDSTKNIGVLKTLWEQSQGGGWSISAIKGLTLRPKKGFAREYFQIESELELMTSAPRVRNFHDLLATFGSTDFLLKQSILPVLAWADDERVIRCIGTAFVISCTGLVVTAGHVLLDPQERDYGRVTRSGSTLTFSEGLHVGVLVPVNPASGQTGSYFLPFSKSWYWGEWKDSPLFHERDEFKFLTDIAICRLPMLPNDVAYQPLNLSLRQFKKSEEVFAIGYAEMADIPFEIKENRMTLPEFKQELYVSVGQVINVYPENHIYKNVPTPGPCAEFQALIPGRMSGGPILGAGGAVVRGVVSRSFSGEKHAFGAMLAPALLLPMGDTTLHAMIEAGLEGIPKMQGADL